MESYPEGERGVVKARFRQVLLLQELTALERLFLGPAVRDGFCVFYL